MQPVGLRRYVCLAEECPTKALWQPEPRESPSWTRTVPDAQVRDSCPMRAIKMV